jgi:hypothetical protein
MIVFIYINILLGFIVDYVFNSPSLVFNSPSLVYNDSDECSLNLPYLVFTKSNEGDKKNTEFNEGDEKNTESNHQPSPSDYDSEPEDDNKPKIKLNDDSSEYNSDIDS